MSVPHDPVSVPALNLRAQYQSIRDEIEPVVRQVLESQMFVLGPEVASLEAEVAAYCAAAHAVGCASGTDALLLPLLALDIGPGDEVITSPYTFFATAGSIWRTGARPVFVDIEPDTYNIDPRGSSRPSPHERRRSCPCIFTARPPTWVRSRRSPSGMAWPLSKTPRRPSAPLTRGAGPARWATWRPSAFTRPRTWAASATAGMMTTDDPQLARRMARLRVHGMEPKYHHHEVGFNSRLDAFQAAVLRVKLRHLDAWTSLRARSPTATAALFASHGLRELVGLPIERPGNFHVYNQFVIRVPGLLSDSLRDYLTAKKIGTEIYYPIPLHLQVCFASLGHKPGDFPHSEAAARQTLALPIYPELTDEEQRYVVGSIHRFIEEHAYPSLASDRAA